MNAIRDLCCDEAVIWSTQRLQATIPSVLQKDEAFSLRLTWFGPDGLPEAGCERSIEVGPCPGIAGMPDTLCFDPADDGHLIVEGLHATGPDCAYVTLQAERCPASVLSNPARVTEKEPAFRIWWGDLHIHTTFSNCSAWACQSPEFAYAFARDASHLDVAAAADHLRGIVAESERWDCLQSLAAAYRQNGRFVPLLAFESSHASGQGGDNNAYYLHSKGPLFWLDRADMHGTSPQVPITDLWDFLRQTATPAITIPHHSGRAGKYRSFAHQHYDPAMEPVFEIYSCWGSSESRWNEYPLSGGNTDEPAYYVDALRAGCRYGVIASSDDHRTLPGGEAPAGLALGPTRQSLYPQQGLTAFRAKELTPEAIWNALRTRSCYATTFDRVLLDVTIADLDMGQESAVAPGDTLWKERTIDVRILAAPGTRAEVILVRNGRELDRKPLTAEAGGQVTFTDREPLDKVALRETRFHPAPFVVYYVRVETGFRQTQWSSPIWLDLAE